MMRFSPSAMAVEMMREGDNPQVAANKVILKISDKYPWFRGSIVALSKNGDFGAACKKKKKKKYTFYIFFF